MINDKFGDVITEARWHKVELCIHAFSQRYPLHWRSFKQDLHENKSEFGLAHDGDLKKAGWRNSAAFPIVYRHATLDDLGTFTGKEEDDLVQVASLLDPLKILLPGLLDQDKKGYTNKVFKEFLRRFPVFKTADKN